MENFNYSNLLCRITGDRGFNDSFNRTWCNTLWDTALCWPQTLANVVVTLQCPKNIPGVNTKQNATRVCDENGTWNEKANYTSCFTDDYKINVTSILAFNEENHRNISDLIINIIYHFGFCISTVALAVAFCIFSGFRNLRCLRNKIHCHLIMSFILRNIIWLAMRHSIEHVAVHKPHLEWLCKALVTAFNYFQSTNFYWMFVEGLHLHMIVVWTYSSEKLQLWHFKLIGWGIPLPLILVWALLKAHFENNSCWIAVPMSNFDYIHCVPVFLVLFANVIFFISIIWILIVKLRMANSPEAVDYRKAVKGALVLLPLLGITYVMFILQPSASSISSVILIYTDTILQSFQGLFVAVFYCFLNSEVRHTIQMKLNCFPSTLRFRNVSVTRSSRVSTTCLHKQTTTSTLSSPISHELLSPNYRPHYDLTPSSSIGDRSLTLFSDSDTENNALYPQPSFSDTHM
ncbi:corticotropin-releasing factor receptor 2 isoform X2 [Octopus sinensis]|uniref:Corticotropin-releasing factor receptor 2 isoform X2 n=2 Tax=Octopus TaxID=6643 RepID=A0A6P7SP72_9MOLL|nr:corticotropin-releasing factor receptor 2 isoform X2 [Octopus sinensis]